MDNKVLVGPGQLCPVFPVSRPVSMGNINKSPSLKARHQLDRPQLAVEIGFILNFSWVNFSCSSSSTKFFCSK